ncbi:NADP-dependent oxidoreductase [Oceanisphaera arctica]|uniref:Alanine dehydrogenase n=1 Tax=Oceanisphaera arctica TaxID=641510 RepID=A0A2P5TP17_9GAMM|nr:NADP-dependent oxidoreductase [Oceanisphaera arctica]PPL17355.1 alanine dehydrogenase [Oceanisphaera arctica]GHA08686.1 quinone oxidoreductase [Oceanisphaera arctica]
MKQLVIKAFGDASQLVLAEASSPALAADQIRVQMHYAGVNPVDAKTRAGLGWGAQAIKDKLPWSPGFEVMGTVLEVGADVGDYAPSDRVFGLLPGGGYSEQLVVSADALLPVPAGVTDKMAAGLSLAGTTAWQGLTEHGGLKAGERVLISAAAGGVGHLAVQLAKGLGATVVALGSPGNHDFLHDLGADEVIDYRDEAALTAMAPVDLFFDLVGGTSGCSLLSHVKSGGRVVTVPTITADEVIAAAQPLGLTATGMLKHQDNQQLALLVKAVAERRLRVEVSHVYPLAEGAAAHRQIETGHTRGKILLQG